MKLRSATVLVTFILFCGTIVNAQSNRFGYDKFGTAKGDTLHYRMLYPDYDTLRKLPLVIFLHGSGERGSDNEAQLKWGVTNFAKDEMMVNYPAIVIAPQCPENMSWSNFARDEDPAKMKLLPTPSKPMELLIALINQMKANNRFIDTNRIYITGLSMGGFGTYDAIERYPNLFAAAVPVCGGGDISKAGSIAHIPIWNLLGSNDQAVSPLYSLSMYNALMKAGAHPGYTQYPETGHFSWLAAYSDMHVYSWMFRQHK